MGDPKKQRKKFSSPSKRWEKERIDREKILIKEYGLKNKKEIWKSESKLRNFTRQAKRLIAITTKQAEKEKEQLLLKLKSLSLLSGTASMENILDLDLKSILDRRLQSLVYKKEMSRSIKSARQMITHGHILVDKTKVTIPSYMVQSKEETLITVNSDSPFSDALHPEMKKDKKIVKVKQ
ncbi:30S ribosomal protein S4 [Candidatus Woesearchaeota archaeon]|jgi:small subunit ribosomal protein S4|nr:30S ribosomal protein S4 [Candidatus Woesearchaeota archaeon]